MIGDGPDDADLRFMDALDASKAASDTEPKSIEKILQDGKASIQAMADENASVPAFPVKSVMFYEHGLTKREYFASLAMQGLCAHDMGFANRTTVADLAVEQADSLLTALESVSPPMKDCTKLTYDDALRIAKGCFDYGGGYRSNDGELDIFHHGIQTVINALEGAQKSGLSDLQS